MTTMLAGQGPLAWSTSREIARTVSVLCWDNNGYYRRLGIGFPYVNATQRAIREGYLARGGPDDASLTQAFIVLINGPEKAVYDALPLGERYPDAEERYRSKMAALDLENHLRITGVLEEMLASGEIEEVPPLDNAESGVQDGFTPAKDPHQKYPYMVVLIDTEDYDPVVLLAWQRHLLDAVRQLGEGPPIIMLGVSEGQGPWTVADTLSVPVFIFDRWVVPSPATARQIITAYLHTK